MESLQRPGALADNGQCPMTFHSGRQEQGKEASLMDPLQVMQEWCDKKKGAEAPFSELAVNKIHIA